MCLAVKRLSIARDGNAWIHTGSVVITPFLIVSLGIGLGVSSRLLSTG
jgi:hypothetical protein